MKKVNFSCQKKAFYNYFFSRPYYLNIRIIFSHQNLTEYRIKYHYLEPNFSNIRIIWTICSNSVLNLISLIKFWFTAVVTWICLTAECWFNKKRTVMMDSDSNIRNRSNIHCKYPVIVYLYLFWDHPQPFKTNKMVLH